ncbi:MAG: peptidoglycan DD-metalloendopeptidase family protein [Algoriphagus sp.]|jgi:septal ring factor EnvC (AmiA/AmiB activator)|uniref:murein hydrolase activator EnvC family protein n=1 Tax=Algoriphagus sp. TaxID=1872435 RepID=UPI00271C7FBC|nr:peptidoglycan DD-metalloendopeptidase family protein [Algoriphagus sp.]MDO8968749.1 peptidoglycan DD-metalloendopeptidase family protein [Algoriphagus sp.]MDP2040127.1 peptidoglycan DD-metalloendopeptidase family protein [Algoriphagus sp.]MDP3199333.1 peptidoglycan DD-metalloendopeptidase family protein [Algoriphagus sp.]MDP3471093.1 peptidoglycan DD-metalloendopeptidase family protein [Algoriphagus sp.]
MYRLISFLAVFLFLGSFEAFSQTKKTREELEREKAEVQARLREFDIILKQTTATKQTSLGELNAITSQFQSQTRLVNTLDREVRLINQEISETEKKIKGLEVQLQDLKSEYSRMIYNSSKLNRGLSIVAFVFSSGNFNQLYMRLKYLKQYSDSRKQQAEQIEKLSNELVSQRALLDQKKIDKVTVLSEEQKEKGELERLRKSQQGVVNTLTKKEKDIQRQITATKKQQEQLNRMIKQVIEDEIRRAEAESQRANSTTTKKAGTSMPMTPEAAALSSSFAGNRGKLPWPVETGFVSQGYGTYPHPTLKGIVQDSDGLEIRTQPNANVRTVFDGTVSKISTIPGYGLTVIIKHGEYFTMYSRLKDISVKVGQTVKAKETIGKVAVNPNGESEVHFQTWKGLQIMDPATWITSK